MAFFLQWKLNIVIPGSSGIPEWVSHQRMGCEITVELPMNWCEDNNLLGFVLFFHHVPLDDGECETTGDGLPRCILTLSHGDQSKQIGDIWFHPECKGYHLRCLSYDYICYDSRATSDPALWVTYFPEIDIPSKFRSSRWNTLKALYTPMGGGSFRCGDNASFKLKSCGIHLIYAQDQIHWPPPSRGSLGDREDHPAKKELVSKGSNLSLTPSKVCLLSFLFYW